MLEQHLMHARNVAGWVLTPSPPRQAPPGLGRYPPSRSVPTLGLFWPRGKAPSIASDSNSLPARHGTAWGGPSSGRSVHARRLLPHSYGGLGPKVLLPLASFLWTAPRPVSSATGRPGLSPKPVIYFSGLALQPLAEAGPAMMVAPQSLLCAPRSPPPTLQPPLRGPEGGKRLDFACCCVMVLRASADTGKRCGFAGRNTWGVRVRLRVVYRDFVAPFTCVPSLRSASCAPKTLSCC